MTDEVRRERSPGMKLFFAGLIGFVLMIPLMMVYWLVWDRQDQSNTAQAAINAGWGGSQVVAGPLIVVPYRTVEQQTETIDGRSVTKSVEVERMLYISPVANRLQTEMEPQEKRKSIYSSMLYTARIDGKAGFELPADLPRFGVTREQLQWDRAELRMGVSDARGLTTGGKLTAGGKALTVEPGKGPASTSGQGYFAFLEWDGTGRLDIDYSFSLRGSQTLTVVPRGGQTTWQVSSSWPNPSFGGDFLPEKPEVSDKGFKATFTTDKLALGQPPVSSDDLGPPRVDQTGSMIRSPSMVDYDNGGSGQSLAFTVGLVEPVDLYSKVDRSVKYGFLFIGFTFLAFLLFEVVGGARVASAEYLLTGAGLVLFFVLLLAFAEVIGFTLAYLVASGAIIGLLTAYSAAVLKSWGRARFIGALLVGLYALLFVLLNLEAWSLLIGSVLLFVALAGVMYATRNVDWGNVSRREVEV